MQPSKKPIRMCQLKLNRAILVCLSGILPLIQPSLCPAATTYTISTVVGTGDGGYAGDSAAATAAQIYLARQMVQDSLGNLYIADQFNNRVRKVDTSGIITTIAGSAEQGYKAEDIMAATTKLFYPCGVVVDEADNVYIADTGNHIVRRINSTGTIVIVAGKAESAGYTGDTGAATSAELTRPTALAFDSVGNLYIADTGNNVVRKVSTSGIITTVAGTGTSGFSGDPGLAINSKLYGPVGLAVDSSNNLYIADSGNHVVRKLNPKTGIISTVAGQNAGGYSGDGGAATSALLNYPMGLRLDSSGNLYIADSLNNRIRMVNSSGIISTIAGTGGSGFYGDGGAATSAMLLGPVEVLLDSSGKIYVQDSGNQRIRLLTPVATTPLIASGGVISASAFGGFGAVAPGSWIEIYGSNLATTARAWTTADFSGVTAPTSLDGTSVTIGGLAAAISYISAGQVNAQVPSGVTSGSQDVTVTTSVGTGSTYTVTVNATQPGFLAPTAFQVGSKQYVGALFSDGTTYVLPTSAVSGITSRPAKPGETIVLYGIGFGAVTPTVASGQIVQGTNTLTSALKIFFNGTEAALSYQGLAPGMVGVYQFNVVVPSVAAGDAVPLTFTLGGVSGTQTLYTAVSN